MNELEKIIAEREAEIKDLKKRIESTRYFLELIETSMRVDITKRVDVLRAALHGNAEKPILRLNENTEGGIK